MHHIPVNISAHDYDIAVILSPHHYYTTLRVMFVGIKGFRCSDSLDGEEDLIQGMKP